MEAMQSAELDKLFMSLSKAQALIEGARETAKNPHFKSSYADLWDVWQACKKPLTDNGLCVVQTIEPSGDKTCLVTMLAHSSGQWIKSVLPMPIVKQDAQGLGSALTYCRRYALAAIVGVSPMDDDAEASMDRGNKAIKQDIKKATITASQSEIIMDAVGGDVGILNRILSKYEMERILDLPASKFEEVMHGLKVLKEKTNVVAAN